MGELRLARVDQRLIHGQVITSWIKQSEANKIIIIDDTINEDSFMKKVFLMAGPPGCKLEVYGSEDGAALWKDGALESDGKIMVLFRTVTSAYIAYEKGFTFADLQIGSAGGAPGRVAVHGAITMNEEEAGKLNEMEASGCNIVFQATPDAPSATWESIREQYFS